MSYARAKNKLTHTTSQMLSRIQAHIQPHMVCYAREHKFTSCVHALIGLLPSDCCNLSFVYWSNMLTIVASVPITGFPPVCAGLRGQVCHVAWLINLLRLDKADLNHMYNCTSDKAGWKGSGYRSLK